MTMPSFPSAAKAIPIPASARLHAARTAHTKPQRRQMMMRKYQIASLQQNGDVRFSEQIAPAIPKFESAFSAFARGTLIATAQGPVAVEDLVPGMGVTTADGGKSPLLWVGSMTLVPNARGLAPEDTKLARIMSDAFGISRPSYDLMAGPGARILSRPTRAGEEIGEERVLTPVRNLVDGLNVIEISPPRPVTVYHLCLGQHAVISAGGLEVETFHPGHELERDMGHNMRALFLAMFPHINEFEDFGELAQPRVPFSSPRELELI